MISEHSRLDTAVPCHGHGDVCQHAREARKTARKFGEDATTA
jgi:hypothetical protein